jgi:CubicO group peptidase (beta-lactamase class C family)
LASAYLNLLAGTRRKGGLLTSLQKVCKHIEQFAELKMKEANIPGLAIAVTDREKLLIVSTCGFADAAAKAPVTTDSLFEIASIGKSLTAIALLQLRDEGKLDLHAPVTQYLPWFQVQSEFQPITVHHLMGHTAGIVRGTELAPHGLYDSWALRETKTSTPPGQYWHYSSIGYKTLGFLLERLTSQSFKDVIQSRVLDPLGMTSTHPVITFETRKRAATGYRSLYDDRPERPSHPLVPAMWSEYGTGDGCQASTVEDMAIYLRMLMNRGRGPRGRLVSEEGFNLMAPLATWTGSEQYGYALVVYPVDGHAYLGHGGGNAGYISHILADMEEGLGVVVLTNRMAESEAVYHCATHVLKVLSAVYHHNEIPPLPPVADPSSVRNATDYVGIYRAGNSALQLTAADGKLRLEYEDRVIRLERRSNDSFYVGHPHFDLFLLEFKRDSGKVVEAFHGSRWYINERYTGPQSFDYPKEWEAYPGHYRTRNPELSNFRVVLRKGALALIFPSGASEPLVPLGGGFFRIGDDHHSPETLRFDAVAEGRAFRADYSGCPYYRTFTL